MANTVNRFPELIDAVRRTSDEDRAAQAAMLAVGRQSEIAMSELGASSPYSTRETLYATRHEPHHIADSWMIMRTERDGAGAKSVVGNSAPHIEWQRYGTPGHDISAQGPWGLTFWTGSPLRWASRHQDGHAGWMRKKSIDHPGFGPWGGSDFVVGAAARVGSELARIAIDAGDEIAFMELRKL